MASCAVTGGILLGGSVPEQLISSVTLRPFDRLHNRLHLGDIVAPLRVLFHQLIQVEPGLDHDVS